MAQPLTTTEIETALATLPGWKFVNDALAKEFKRVAKQLAPAGMVWISWPKKSSGVATDLDENLVRDIGLAAGLVDVKVCAVTDVWSGLKFVRRVKDR